MVRVKITGTPVDEVSIIGLRHAILIPRDGELDIWFTIRVDHKNRSIKIGGRDENQSLHDGGTNKAIPRPFRITVLLKF
jgi:hypothetical protein